MKHRPKKLSYPKRVEFLLDGFIYDTLVQSLPEDYSVSEYLRTLILNDLSVKEVKEVYNEV